MTYVIMSDNGPAEPQIGYIDGYSFADTLLEGVLFKIESVISLTGERELVCNSYDPDCDNYMAQFVPAQIDKWCQRALQYAIDKEELLDAEGDCSLYLEKAE